MIQDTSYIHHALSLSLQALGNTSSNPLVGCVITKNEKIIGEGYHQKYGQPHAEVNAVKNAEKNGNSTEGSTVYVTLEPCNHHGKTPPCADLLIKKKVQKVVICNIDPNPQATGGIEKLQQAGIEVEIISDLQTGKHAPLLDLKKIGKSINKFFFHFQKTKKPFYLLKSGITKNGCVSEEKNTRTQITGKKFHQYTHLLRQTCDAILVGANTVLIDNPKLNVRYDEFDGEILEKYFGVEMLHTTSLQITPKNPLRIILDPHFKTQKTAKIYQDENFLLVTENKNAEKIFPKKNILLLSNFVGDSHSCHLQNLQNYLIQKNIQSLLIEGGTTTIQKFLESGMCDEYHLGISPKIFEKKNTLSLFQGKNSVNAIKKYLEKYSISPKKEEKLEKDILMTFQKIY